MIRLVSIFAAVSLLASPALAQTAPATPPKEQAKLSAQSFAAPPFVEDPTLSPNGQFIAGRFAVGGKQILLITPLFDRTIQPASFDLTSEKVSVDWWRWVNDEWLLLGVSASTYVEGVDFRLRRVLAISRTTNKINKLAWNIAAENGAQVIHVFRDGSPRILLGVQRSIYLGPDFWTSVIEMDVSTGKFRNVVRSREGVMSYYADGAGNVRVGYGYSDQSRTARLLYRPGGQGSFKEIDRANVRLDERLTAPDTFLAEPGKATTIAANEDGFLSLFELDLTTMERGKKIFGVDGYDIDGVLETPGGDGVAGIYVTKDRSYIHWLDPDLAKTQSEIDQAVGAGRARIVSWSRDRTKLLVMVGGPDQAGAYYVYDRTLGGTMLRFAFANDQLKMTKLSPVSTIAYKARDGLEIRGVLTLPKDRAAKNLPLILLPHGGPEARDSEGYDWWVQFLAWRGYAVFQPNYRGSTGFGKKFLELGEGEWGLKMQDDLNDAVTDLAKKNVIDPKRVCVVGASYGGYAAMRAAQRDGTLYRCAISYAGVSDLPGMRRYDRQFLNGATAADGWKESAPSLDTVSPLRHPGEFSAPILLMHGKNDLRVPVRQSREMATALAKAGKAHRYIEQPLGDHHFSRADDRLQFLTEMDMFLRQYNPPD